MHPSIRAFDGVLSRPSQGIDRLRLPNRKGDDNSDSRATRVCQNSAPVSGRAQCI